LDRASAVLILNSVATGRPKAIMEGSLISAKRTAASAALAARVLRRNETSSAAMVGCGLINVEIARFLCAAFPKLSTFYAYDADHDRALQYKEQCEAQFPGAKCIVLKKMRELLGSSTLISFATTALEPHVHDLSMCASGTVILHVSLRDIAPELVLSNDNIVDDVDHVCRAQTSVHLAEQKTGRRDFIRGTLGEILNGQCAARSDDRDLVIYSPFGLGILDVALGEYLFQQAVAKQIGLPVPSFFPHSWKRIPAGT
jgi:N-[(2S)-2-amino-2-carboxyethyl]-L-glutamate dehydrogenase